MPGSSCHARPGTGRRPCARGQPAAARAGWQPEWASCRGGPEHSPATRRPGRQRRSERRPRVGWPGLGSSSGSHGLGSGLGVRFSFRAEPQARRWAQQDTPSCRSSRSPPPRPMVLRAAVLRLRRFSASRSASRQIPSTTAWWSAVGPGPGGGRAVDAISCVERRPARRLDRPRGAPPPGGRPTAEFADSARIRNVARMVTTPRVRSWE